MIPIPVGMGMAVTPSEWRVLHGTVAPLLRFERAIPCALGLALLLCGEARAQSPWSDQTVDSVPEFALTESAVQIDAQNRPHVFVGGDRVYHYWQDGGVWHGEVVDPTPRSGQRLRAATGPSGEFHLVYDRWNLRPESTPYSLFSSVTRHYATNLGGAWTVEKVPPSTGDSATQYKVVTGLVVDASHKPHFMSYSLDLGASTQSLYLQSRSPGGWSIEQINDDPNFGQGHTATSFSASSQLAIDGAGRIHAIWFTASGDQLVYSVRDGTGWHHELLTSVAGQNLAPGQDQTSLVVGASGTAHIFLNNSLAADDGYMQFLHLSNPSGPWQLDDLGHAVPRHASAVDAAGHAHVFATFPVAAGETGASYTHQTEAGWTSESIPAQALQPQLSASASLRVDGMGRAHLATLLDPLFPSTSRSLRYLQRDSAWSGVEIATSGPVIFDSDFSTRSDDAMVGADVRIALVDGHRHLVYRTAGLGGGRALVRRAVEQPSGFALESLPYTGTFPYVEARSLALAVAPGGGDQVVWIDGGGILSVLDSGPVQALLGFPGPAVARATRRPAVAFGASGDLHVLFAGIENPGMPVLGEVTQAGQTVSFGSVGPLADFFGGYQSYTLALSPGPLGAMHAAYVDDDGDVVHATNATGTWTTEVVGTPPFDTLIASHSLLVEPDGTVHIAYERFSVYPGTAVYYASGLAYGTNRCHGEFAVTEVDPLIAPSDISFSLGSKNPDLALDANGNPHVSYRRDADHSLGYAHIHDGRFALETVVADSYTGENSAIAVAGDGTVSIGHHDPWAGDLRLATRAPLAAEPRWDGCPPLPDPNEVLDGTFLLTTPPGALPLYDPFAELVETYGPVHAQFWLSPAGGGKLGVTGEADSDGNSSFDAWITGKGSVSGNGRMVRVKYALATRDRDPAVPPKAKIKVTRSEVIDPSSRQRSVVERASGKVDAQRVSVKRSSADVLPAQAFGLNLRLEISSAADGLHVFGGWQTRGGELAVTGTGSWSADTKSAELHLKGEKGSHIDIRISGARLWRSEADGFHLRADAISVRGLGQRVNADLSSAY
jgi:hypothetical protein